MTIVIVIIIMTSTLCVHMIFFFFERKRQTHERHTNQACCVCDRVLANAEKRPGVLDPHR